MFLSGTSFKDLTSEYSLSIIAPLLDENIGRCQPRIRFVDPYDPPRSDRCHLGTPPGAEEPRVSALDPMGLERRVKPRKHQAGPLSAIMLPEEFAPSRSALHRDAGTWKATLAGNPDNSQLDVDLHIRHYPSVNNLLTLST